MSASKVFFDLPRIDTSVVANGDVDDETLRAQYTQRFDSADSDADADVVPWSDAEENSDRRTSSISYFLVVFYVL